MTTNIRHHRFEDRLIVELRHLVTERPLRSAPPHSSGRVRSSLSLSLAVVVAAAGSVAIIVSLGDSHQTGIAKADVVKRASAALAQPRSIVHLSAVSYGETRCRGEQAPARCIGSPSVKLNSANLTPGQASYTFEDWTNVSNETQHTVYGTGDETLVEGHKRTTFDPANNTVTTTEPTTASPEHSGPAFPDLAGLGAEEIRALYEEATRGTSPTKLLGQVTLAGRQAYELEITQQHSTLLLYVDRETFLPMRIVWSTLRATGERVTSVTDFAATTIPVTAESTALLRMKTHPGARQIQLSEPALSAEIAVVKPERASQSNASKAAQADPLAVAPLEGDVMRGSPPRCPSWLAGLGCRGVGDVGARSPQRSLGSSSRRAGRVRRARGGPGCGSACDARRGTAGERRARRGPVR
jgi:hypothetical protein